MNHMNHMNQMNLALQPSPPARLRHCAPTLPSGRAPRAVLFDLDGTLLHTAPDLATAVNALLADLGRAPLGENVVDAMIGKGLQVLVERALNASEGLPWDAPRTAEAHGATHPHLATFRAHYARCSGAQVRDYPDMRAGLTAFAARGIKLGVVTNKAHEFTVPLLEKAGLPPLADGGDHV